jgi:ribosomal protein L21
VLAHKSGGSFAVGQPYLEGVKVEAEVLEELKGPKVRLLALGCLHLAVRERAAL